MGLSSWNHPPGFGRAGTFWKEPFLRIYSARMIHPERSMILLSVLCGNGREPEASRRWRLTDESCCSDHPGERPGSRRNCAG